MGNVFRSVLAAARAILQSKTVAAGTSDITVSPDSGYDGLSSVTVQPTPSQTKSVNPTRAAQTVSPDSGKLLSSVSVGEIPSEYIIPSGAKSITANGTGIDVSSYATANVNVPNPTLSGNATAADVANGKTFYSSNYTKQTGSYVAPTINNITPSDSSPVSMSANSNYKPSKKGYAIESYDNSVTQSAMANGAYFPSGMVKMPIAGYAYSSRPSMTETTLWTNSSPTSSFSSQTVTLTQNMTNYQYLKFDVNVKNTSDTKSCSYIFPISSVQNSIEGANQPRLFLSINGGGGGQITRPLVYKTNTSIQIGGATTSNAYCIPTKISGLKL